MQKEYFSTLEMNEDEVNYLKLLKEMVYFKSNLSFLQRINGLRPGATHLVIAPPGGGKSTLCKTFIRDLQDNAPKSEKLAINILVILSEQKINDLKSEFINLPDFGNNKRKNIHIFSEMELVDENHYHFNFMRIKEMIKFTGARVIIYDNLTTSQYYSVLPPWEQYQFCFTLKKLAEETQNALILFAHTGAQFNKYAKRMISVNDIRGTKDIVNLAQFVYILQTFQIVDYKVTTVAVAKDRDYESEGQFYRLEYSSEMRVYKDCMRIDYNAIKAYFDKMDRL